MSLEILAEINKKFGEGSIVNLGDNQFSKVESIPFGIIGLDIASCIGGIPRGKIIEIYGESGTGKSCVCLLLAGNAQKQGLNVAFVDMEQGLDTETAKMLGVNVDALFVAQPSSGNDALTIAEMLVKSGDFGLVIIDSVAMLVPQEELDGEFGQSNIGRRALLVNQACRKLNPICNETNTSIVFTNQLRDNVGAFGFQETTIRPAGKALGFAATMGIELKRLNQVKDGELVVGHKVKATFKKNRAGTPFKVAQYEITYGQNAVKSNEIIDLGSEKKIIDKKGAWYYYDGHNIGQGRESVKSWLSLNPEKATEIEEKIRKEYGLMDNTSDEKSILR